MVNTFFPYLESWAGGGEVSLGVPAVFGAMGACIVLSILRLLSSKYLWPLMVPALPLLLIGLFHPLLPDLGMIWAMGSRLGVLGAISALTGIVAQALYTYPFPRGRVLGAVSVALGGVGAGMVLLPRFPGALVIAGLCVVFGVFLVVEFLVRSPAGEGRSGLLVPAGSFLVIGGAALMPSLIPIPLPGAAVQGFGLCVGLFLCPSGRPKGVTSPLTDTPTTSPGSEVPPQKTLPLVGEPIDVTDGTSLGDEEKGEAGENTQKGMPNLEEGGEEPLLSDYVDRVSIALTRFIPKEFLAILDRPSVVDLRLGDHVKRDMTIFFSDIRQFTTLSEELSPEESFKFINSYLARIVPVITACGGFVDKYMGDAVMALFANAGGADAAVNTAIEMQKKIVEYNGHRANCGYRPLSMGIGLHTGTLMLGVVGVEDRMQNTVISDAVNLASRLESISKVFNISLAISEETFKNLEDPGAYMYRFIGKVRVKGKVEPVSVFEIFDGVDPYILDRKMKANSSFEQGMLCYYRKDFTEAMFNFRKVLEVLPDDGASAFYLDNCMGKVRA